MQGDDRYGALLQAGMSLASELSLSAVLQRIVELAVDLTGARYGALGVLGVEEPIAEFITTGISDEDRARIGHIPRGEGLLGLLIDDPQTLRLARISDHRASVGFPAHHPPMVTFLGTPVTARGRVFGNIYLTEKAGGDEFTEDDQETLEVLAAQAGVAISNARVYEESQRRRQSLEAFSELGERILAGDDLESILGQVAAHARQLVDGEVGMIVGRQQGSSENVVLVADGYGAERLRGMEVPVEGSISGRVMASGRPEVVPDAATHGAYPPLVAAAEMGPTIWVPMRLRGESLGALSVAKRRGGHAFGTEDLALVQVFANQASVAMESARGREERERLNVMDDRERIGRELHDGVIQSLFAVGMNLQGTAMAADDEETRRRIEGAVDEIDRTIRDLRNYIFGLRPSLLAGGGLDTALEKMVNEFSSATGVVAIAEIEPAAARALGGRAADVVQLTREALSNVGRHADASTCRVSLRLDDSSALLEIDDDGDGFDLAGITPGQGLGNLRLRAEQLGGLAVIDSIPGEGTTVSITIPVQDREPTSVSTSAT